MKDAQNQIAYSRPHSLVINRKRVKGSEPGSRYFLRIYRAFPGNTFHLQSDHSSKARKTMKQSSVLSIALIPFACCSVSLAAAAPARQSRATPAKGRNAAAPAEPLQLRCELQILDESGDEPVSRRADTNEVFVSGERFRIRVTAGHAGYVYILLRGSRGETQLLFPYATASDRHSIQAGEPADIPAADWFRFDTHPGVEHVYVAVSSSMVPELEKALSSGKENLEARQFGAILQSLASSASAKVERLNLTHLP